MASPADYEKRIKTLLQSNSSFKAKTVPDAKVIQKTIIQTQKELRQIKKEIALTMKDLRAQYATQKAGVGKAGFGKGVMQGIFGKKSVSHMDAQTKDRIRQAQVKQLAPYEALQAYIDRMILEYDKHKLTIDGWISEQS